MRSPLLLVFLMGCSVSSKQETWDECCDRERSRWFLDADGDGYGDEFETTHPGLEACAELQDVSCDDIGEDVIAWEEDADSDSRRFGKIDGKDAWFVRDNTDCNDKNETVNPGAKECKDVEGLGASGEDDDCDGVIDEAGLVLSCYPDADGDGYYSGEVVKTCAPSGVDACTAPYTDVEPSDPDCDDGEPSISPGQIESECADAVDQDCDERTDCAIKEGAISPSDDVVFKVTGVEDVLKIAMRGGDLNSDGFGELVYSNDAGIGALLGSSSEFSGLSLDYLDVRTATSSTDFDLAFSATGSSLLIGNGDAGVVYSVSMTAAGFPDSVETLVDSSSGYPAFGAAVASGLSAGKSSGRWVAAYRACNLFSEPYFTSWVVLSYLGTDEQDKLFSISNDDEITELSDCSGSPPALMLWEDPDDATPPNLAILTAEQDLYLTSLPCDGSLEKDVDELPCQSLAVNAITPIRCPDADGLDGVECIALATASEVTLYKYDAEATTATSCLTPVGAPLTVANATSLSGAGDVDGDGYEDLIVGAEGSAYLYLTEVTEASEDADPPLVSHTYYATFQNTSVTGPYQVAGGADLDGDGFDDIAILAGGTIYLLPGGPPD